MGRGKISLDKIGAEDVNKLADIYKEVFAGHPWHEDLICQNASEGKCCVQYTFDKCNFYDSEASGDIVNDCRDGFIKRVGDDKKQEIVLLTGNRLENCVGCGEPLKTIDYYPDFRDQFEIIEESLRKPGFAGFLAKDNTGRLVGFSWGYTVPEDRTTSVNFPKLNPLFKGEGFDPEECFYASEIGVIAPFQKQGIGGILSRARLLSAHKQNKPKVLVTRTINPMVHSYLTNIFSGNKASELCEDPETAASWFAWKFDNFDEGQVIERLEKNLKNPEIVLDI